MRAAVIRERFGLSEIEVMEVSAPKPGPNQVLLRLRAASLNYRDVMVAAGSYNPRYPLPLVLGSDAVGEIVELGPGSEHGELKLGARVCAMLAQGWLAGPPPRSATRNTLGGPLPGVFAEYAVVRSDSLLRVPEYLTDIEAATLPCAALTAWSALKTLAETRSGDVVLTLGSGGVSLFALQIAQRSGARVLTTSRAERKHAQLLALGAERVLDANQADWGRQARELAGGEGVDHVIDVGGAETLPQSFAAVRPGGIVSLIGVLSGNESRLNLLPIVMRNLRVQGVFVGHRQSFEAMLQFFEREQLRPVVDSVYPLSAVADAFARLSSGQHVGKVCLSL